MFLSVRNPKSQRLFLLHLRSIGPSHFSSGPQNYKMLPNYSLTLLASPDYVWIWISATTSVLQKHQTLLLARSPYHPNQLSKIAAQTEHSNLNQEFWGKVASVGRIQE
ncbi:hypothetical protein HKD37_14G039249 [Glycine soja]